jgi:hypothetical protein
MMQKEEWPADLLKKAQELDGKLRTIDKMDPSSIQQATKALFSLAFEVRLAESEDARKQREKPREVRPAQQQVSGEAIASSQPGGTSSRFGKR